MLAHRMLEGAMLLAACAVWSAAAPAAADNWVYVSIAGESRIAQYRLARRDGALEHVSDTAVAGTPAAMGVDPSQQYLFVSIRSTGALASFRIDPETGHLEHLSTVAAGADPAFVATDRTGNWLLSAYYQAGKIAVHRLEEGRIAAEPTVEIETAERAHAIVPDARNRYLFVPHTRPNLILGFAFDAETGGLTPLDRRVEAPENTGPRHLWFHPTAPLACVSNEQASSVTSYRLQRNRGGLAPVSTLSTVPRSFHESNATAHVELSPNGRFCYVANRGHNSLAAFALDVATGELKFVSFTPTEDTPRSFSIDPSGNWLVAAGQASGRLAVYHIESESGQLEPVATVEAGDQPWWVQCVNPQGRARLPSGR